MASLKKTLQNEYEGLDLELSLAPPSWSSSSSVTLPTTLIPPSMPSPPSIDMSIGPTPYAWLSQLQTSQPEPSQPSPSPARQSPPRERRQNKRKSTKGASAKNNEELPSTSEGKRQRTKADDTPIKPPYPWSTNLRSRIHTLNYLLSNNIKTITGDVKCNQCKEKYKMEYDLVSKFDELVMFVIENVEEFHDRAPSRWMTSILPNCNKCNKERCVEAVIPAEKDSKLINWLFMLLGQMIGCLKLEQLKYFCAQTSNHRTGAKDRLIYLAYITLINQLQPSVVPLPEFLKS